MKNKHLAKLIIVYILITITSCNTQTTQIVTNARQSTSTPLIKVSPTTSGKIVYSSNQDLIHFDIYIMDSDGNNQIKLTNHEIGLIYWDPDWSPDGTRIVFSGIPDDSKTSELYIMNADGNNQCTVSRRTYTLRV